MPNVSRTTARYDAVAPAPPASGLVSPMRSSRQQQQQQQYTTDAYLAPSSMLLPPLIARSPDASSTVPPHLLEAILATVARANEARFMQEREATQAAVTQTNTRLEAVTQALLATRSSMQSALRDAVDDMRSTVRQEMSALDSRVAACERAAARGGDAAAVADAHAAVSVTHRALEQRMDALQTALSTRLAEMRVEVDATAASRAAGDDATSTRIASLSRQLADVSTTAAAALARASDASHAAAQALDAAPSAVTARRAPVAADGVVLEDGTFEDGHAGPRLITRVAFDAFATGMRADMEALRASTRDALRSADDGLHSAVQAVQADMSDALARLDNVTANRLDVVTSTLSDGIADVAERLKDTTQMVQQLYNFTHDTIPSLQASLARHIESSRADVDALMRAGDKREAALGDALLRGLTQEVTARDDAIADAMAQAHADAQSVVSVAVKELHAALERVRLDAQVLYDRSRTNATSSDGALVALQRAFHGAIDEAKRGSREAMDKVRSDMLAHVQDSVAAAQRSQSTADAALLGVERLQAAHEGQADVLRNLDATVTELSTGVSTYAATLEQHDATLSQIVEGELRVFLTTQADRLTRAELDIAAVGKVASDLQSLKLELANVREDVTAAGRARAAEAVHVAVEALSSGRDGGAAQTLSDSQQDVAGDAVVDGGQLAVFRNIDRSITEIISALRSHASSIDALRTQAGTIIPKVAEIRTDCDELRASVHVLTRTTATRSTERELKLHEALAAHDVPAARASGHDSDKLGERVRDLERQVGEHETRLAAMSDKGADVMAAATGIDAAGDAVDASFRSKVERVLAQHTEALGDVAVQADLHLLHDTLHAALRTLQTQVETALRCESDARYDAVTQLQLRISNEEKTRNAELDDLANEIRDHLAKAVDISTQRSVVALQRQLQPLAAAHDELQIRVEVERCMDYLLDTISDAFAPQVALAVAEHAVSAALATSRSTAGMRSSRLSLARLSSTEDTLAAATARAGPPMHALPATTALSASSDADFTGMSTDR